MTDTELMDEILAHQRRALVYTTEAHETPPRDTNHHYVRQVALCLAELCGFAATVVVLLQRAHERITELEECKHVHHIRRGGPGH